MKAKFALCEKVFKAPKITVFPELHLTGLGYDPLGKYPNEEAIRKETVKLGRAMFAHSKAVVARSAYGTTGGVTTDTVPSEVSTLDETQRSRLEVLAPAIEYYATNVLDAKKVCDTVIAVLSRFIVHQLLSFWSSDGPKEGDINAGASCGTGGLQGTRQGTPGPSCIDRRRCGEQFVWVEESETAVRQSQGRDGIGVPA